MAAKSRALPITGTIPFPRFMDGTQVCKNYDPDIWFPNGRDYSSIAIAVELCEGCPLKIVCGKWATEVGEPDGVWGGLTPEDRRKVRKVMAQRKLTFSS